LTATPANSISFSRGNPVLVATPSSALSASTAPTVKAGNALSQCATASFKGASDINGTTITFVPATPDFTATTVAGKSVKASTSGSILTVTATEGFTAAFKTFGEEISGGPANSATNGTRIVVMFTNLPSNVVIFAPNEIDTASAAVPPGPNFNLTLVSGADANGAANEAAAPAAGNAGQATLISGTSVTYEVTSDDPNAIEKATIPVGLMTIGTPTAATAGAANASVEVGPVSAVLTSTSGAPIPRFIDKATSDVSVTVVSCVTNILFPYVTNTAGFDTGVAVMNTTKDNLGTTAQDGQTCTYNFFGTNAPSGGTVTGKAINGGAYESFTLSGGGPDFTGPVAPGFTGYVIATCGFQLGHGLYFFTNGTTGVGGNALIIPQPTATSGGGSRKNNASTILNGAIGEGLGH
jgi:hypothetical protein